MDDMGIEVDIGSSKKWLKFIHESSNPKETKRKQEQIYGHSSVGLYYFKEGEPIARVFKTDGDITSIVLYVSPPSAI